LNRIFAAEISMDGDVFNILSDWALLKLLNQISITDTSMTSLIIPEQVKKWEDLSVNAILFYLENEENSPKIPVFSFEAILLPNHLEK
jgi:hypothetical protein